LSSQPANRRASPALPHVGSYHLPFLTPPPIVEVLDDAGAPKSTLTLMRMDDFTQLYSPNGIFQLPRSTQCGNCLPAWCPHQLCLSFETAPESCAASAGQKATPESGRWSVSRSVGGFRADRRNASLRVLSRLPKQLL
jgi:hypothetical protein